MLLDGAEQNSARQRGRQNLQHRLSRLWYAVREEIVPGSKPGLERDFSRLALLQSVEKRRLKRADILLRNHPRRRMGKMRLQLGAGENKPGGVFTQNVAEGFRHPDYSIWTDAAGFHRCMRHSKRLLRL